MTPRLFIRGWRWRWRWRRLLCSAGRHGYETFRDQMNVGFCPRCGVVLKAPKAKAMRYEDKSR